MSKGAVAVVRVLSWHQRRCPRPFLPLGPPGPRDKICVGSLCLLPLAGLPARLPS